MYCTLCSSTRHRWFRSILTKSDCRSRQLTDCTPPAVHQCVGDRRTWWRVWRNVRTGKVRSGSDYTAAALKREKPAAHSFSDSWTIRALRCTPGPSKLDTREKMCCCAKANDRRKWISHRQVRATSFHPRIFVFFLFCWGFEQCWQSRSDPRGLAWHDMKQRFHVVCQI